MSVFIGFVDDEGRLTLDYPKAVRVFLKTLAGNEVECELRKRRTKRSDRQNRAFHAMVTPWAQQEGHRIDDLKRDLMGEIFGWSEKTSPLSGQRVPLREHTSTLNVRDFNELMERSVEIAASCGVILEMPDEYKARRRNEQKKRRAA